VTLRVAHLSALFPHLTETFVYREVLALRRLGVEVHPFACWKPASAALSQEAAHLVDETVFVFPLRPLACLLDQLRALATRPRVYLGLVARALLQPRGVRDRVLTLGHVIMGAHLAPAMRRAGITHIHAHFCINAATIGLTASRLLDLPFSWTAHNLLFTRNLLLDEKVRSAAFVACISEHTRARLLELGLPAECAPLVRCGLPRREPGPRQAPQRADAPPRLLFVAQLQPRKGGEVLVEACARLAARGVAFHADLIGEGPCRPALEEAIERLGLGERVTLRGALPQEELQQHWSAASLFVLPCVIAPDGDRDGIPVALMEAMQQGLPVVSTPVSGIPELVQDGVTGRLVPEGDPEALAACIEEVLADPELRARLADAGKARVAHAFDADRGAALLAEAFERVQAARALTR
jgi:colanic acid/amylovoran biosynthesis glycosyltransferase